MPPQNVDRAMVHNIVVSFMGYLPYVSSYHLQGIGSFELWKWLESMSIFDGFTPCPWWKSMEIPTLSFYHGLFIGDYLLTHHGKGQRGYYFKRITGLRTLKHCLRGTKGPPLHKLNKVSVKVSWFVPIYDMLWRQSETVLAFTSKTRNDLTR